MKTLDQILNEFPAETRAEIQARSEDLILEEQALRRMRKARKLTQERMAELLGVRQDSISRLERRSDLLLSTLTSYIEAMGGKLRLVVKFEDEQPVEVPSLLDFDEQVPVNRCDYVHTSWDSLLANCVWSDTPVTANSNIDHVITPVSCGYSIRLTCPAAFAVPMDPHAMFGSYLVYRYDPPHQRFGCSGWGKSDPQSEPADQCV